VAGVIPHTLSSSPLQHCRTTLRVCGVWYEHVLQEEDDWVKKCMEYEVEGPRPTGRPKWIWREVVEKDCQARKLNTEML